MEAGYTAGSLLQGRSNTGERLDTRGKVETSIELAVFAIALFAVNAEAIPKADGKLTVVPNPPKPYSESELNAARYASELGFDVTLRPPAPGKPRGTGTSDLLLEEEHPFISREIQGDIYTPEPGTPPEKILNRVRAKNDQAEVVVIDLTRSSVRPEELGDVLARVQGKIRAEKGARAINIKRIVIISGPK